MCEGGQDGGVRALLILGGTCGPRPQTGVEMRRAFLLKAVASFAQTSAFVTSPATSTDNKASMAATFRVHVGAVSADRTPSRFRRVSRLVRLWPRRATDRTVAALRDAVARWAGPFDLVLIEELQDLRLLHSALHVPIALDLDDLRSDGVLQQLQVRLVSRDGPDRQHPTEGTPKFPSKYRDPVGVGYRSLPV